MYLINNEFYLDVLFKKMSQSRPTRFWNIFTKKEMKNVNSWKSENRKNNIL